MSKFSISGVYDLPIHHASAAFTSKTSEVFKEDDNIAPIIINERMQYIPWGGDNQMPFNIISLIESDETLSTCQMFNAEVCYGSGLVYDTTQATAQTQQAVERIELLNTQSPLSDLQARAKKIKKFAVLSRIPTPDSTYYPILYYAALFKRRANG